MLHRYINPFLGYCQLADFSPRSIQALTSRLNEFKAFLKSQRIRSVNPNVAKVGGLQSQGVKGENVVGYLDPLTTQDLKSSGFPVG